MQDQDIKGVLSEYLDQSLPAAQASALVARLKAEPELRSTALTYWVISEAMSGVTSASHSESLQARIAKQLEQEPHFMPQHHRLAMSGQAQALARFGLSAEAWVLGGVLRRAWQPLVLLRRLSGRLVLMGRALAPQWLRFQPPQVRLRSIL